MGRLSRFEDKLEQLVSGVFARTFRSAVQPVEIAAQLAREADKSAQVLSRDRRIISNIFHVELSPSDHDNLDRLGPQLPAELAELLTEHATEQRYVFAGPVSIDLIEDPSLSTGRLRIRSATEAGVTNTAGDPTATAVRRATAILSVNGDDLPLSAPGIVIGRGSDVDLRIEDPGVSRRHIQIRVVDSDSGPIVSAEDLGSTNGMLVDGRRVDQARLRDGATIRIGNTTMSVRVKDL
ncbi:MAG TPA: DUF3662 and FHA domain-containing protein [Marmoricola sp.]|nr:DUF3662 and FHA domain-containing protein [Marmoricola sp.]HNI70651.1 DUF3662 and FHA domain-containing protein [Marmoricola sp.]